MYPQSNEPPRFLIGLLITLLLGSVTMLVNTAPAQAAPDALTTIDADGDVDIVVAAQSDDEFFWLENDGSVSPGFTERSRMSGSM